MTSKAPDFSEGFPSAGERIGPAWQDAWDWLGSEDRWMNSGDIATTLAERYGLQVTTVKTLLRKAYYAGLLEQRMQIPNGRKRKAAHYRVCRSK